ALKGRAKIIRRYATVFQCQCARHDRFALASAALAAREFKPAFQGRHSDENYQPRRVATTESLIVVIQGIVVLRVNRRYATIILIHLFPGLERSGKTQWSLRDTTDHRRASGA